MEAVQKLISDSKQKKVLQQIISQKEEDIKNLQQQIASKEREIGFIEARDSTLKASYQKEIEVMKSQLQVYDKALTDVQKLLKKEKRKRIFTGVIGIVTTTGAYLIGSGILK